MKRSNGHDNQRIAYVVGDATRPIGDGPMVIAHITNDRGAWGGGFTCALSKRWPDPETAYLNLAGSSRGLVLGDVQFVRVAPDIEVANMCAQTLDYSDGPPIRYWALAKCLHRVADRCRELGATLHGPRFGSGLAGGDWKSVEKYILAACEGIGVTIYDLARTT